MAQENKLLKDEYIIKWLTGLSEGTLRCYVKEFEEVLAFLGMTPKEIIQKRMTDLISTNPEEKLFFEGKWRQYKAYLEAQGVYSDPTIHNKVKIYASFFSRILGKRNGLSLAKGEWDSTQKQSFSTPKFKVNKAMVKDLYAHASLRDKCLLLALAQSGFSEIDINELKVEHIQGLENLAVNEHVFIFKPRNKTNHVQATCLSFEFIHDLKLLLSERKQTQGFIFTSQTVGKEKGVNEGLPIETRQINLAMKNLAEKTLGTEKAKEFKTKALRSFYNGALTSLDITQEVKDLMMGHTRGGARNNYECFEDTVKKAYSSIFEQQLSINGIQVKEDIKTLKAEMAQKEEYHALENKLLKGILASLMSREQLEKLLTLQLNHDTTSEILNVNPNRNFSMTPPKVEIDLKECSKEELIKMYFENATSEDNIKESKEKEERARLAHEESNRIRQKIKEAKEKAKANVVIGGTYERKDKP
jgi:hypothetical protein